MILLPSSSRFKSTPLITFQGKTTFGSWVPPDFLSTAPSTPYIVETSIAGRPDLISQQFYGTPEFFWAIIAYNNPENPLNWPAAGALIQIPNAADVFAEQ